MLDDADLEGVAGWLFTRSRLHPADPCDPFELARALGVTIIETRERVCAALVANDPPLVMLRVRRDERATAFALAHELAHLGMRRCGIREQTECDADEIARRMLVPSGFVRVECLVRGRTIAQLPALAPLVDPRVVIARARHVLGLHVPVREASAAARSNSSAA
ncbi:MAG TPA: hypothetical protein VFJ25_09160 [Casimicrobiaceae bacterium]|nr:hypothetical protein [Casimicrobiaceae bacterium]